MAGIDRLTDLAAPIANLEPRVDGTPLRSLGWIEVAAALAKLTDAGADLLRAVYLDDAGALARTLGRLKVSFSGTPGLSVDMREALAVATLQAYIAMRPCQHCNGRGFVHTPATQEMDDAGEWSSVPAFDTECGHCHGQGMDHIELGSVQLLLGVSEPVWEALLREPFQLAYRELRHTHEQASAILARRLR
ncbi:hypothetical protein [Paraburkholderia youngii]|uniref:hypothetical protein n=1 Tax=Paraburkholderia youngii TaxID=2782701 RepID=UPI0015926C49|nr:hypothetical protein [Paraburkholderia youngii]NUX58684.1 hypothetical protein [Paraburkholderia youngii]